MRLNFFIRRWALGVGRWAFAFVALNAIAADFGNIPRALTLSGCQGVRRNAGDTAFEAFDACAGGGSFTPGNLTDAGTDGITVTGGTNAVNGSGTSLSQHVADSTHNGYLSSSDWSTFNGKEDAFTFRYSLTLSGGFANLDGDVASPGTSKCYSTDGSGVKGWNDCIESVAPIALTKTTGFDENGYGFVVSTGTKAYYTAHFSGTITKWSIIATGSSPTATIDVWKVASGTVLPTVSDSIIGAGTKPSIASGNAVPPTSPAGWTTIAVTYGDIFAFNVDAVTNATRIVFELQVNLN